MSVTKRARIAIWGVPVGLQLSALYTLLLVATLALLGWGLYAQLDQFLVKNTADSLELAATTVLRDPHSLDHRGPDRSFPTNAGSTPSEIAALALIRELSAPDVTVAVLDADGGVISSTLTFNGSNPRPVPTLPPGMLDKMTGTSEQSAGPPQAATEQWVAPAPGGGRQLVLIRPINVNVVTFSTVTEERLILMQAASLDAADATLNQLRLYLILGLLIGTVVGVPAGLGLTRAVLKPLDRMARTAEAIAGGDLDRRLRMPMGRNEVARLGGAFDHMVDRLAATLQAQRRFVADASHELRTPLTSLEGLSEMLLIGADRGDSGAVQRMARSMHGELSRMARLVTDLLTLSRLDSAAPMSFMPVDAGKLLDNIAEQFAPMAEARQVHLLAAKDGPVPVQADPDRLKQVILNLVDNALRYTPPGGQVILRAMHDPTTRTARIQVQDTGVGIPPEDLPRIFDRFYRGDLSRARASGNTGLGLAIVRAIVQAHGGTIEVQSTPGVGTVFTVVLPAYQVTTQASDQQAAPATLAGPNREDAKSAGYAKVK